MEESGSAPTALKKPRPSEVSDDSSSFEPALGLGGEKAGVSPYTAVDYATSGLYFDSASRHPLPISAAARLQEYARFITVHDETQGLAGKQRKVRQLFAEMIGADRGEVALLPGTTFGERAVLRALGLPDAKRAIITDELHYSNSLNFYRAAQKAGARIEILPNENGQIAYSRLEALLGRGAALVAISSVSHYNGFAHDLAQVCQMAHARGALVFADVIQHAGSLPFNVRNCNVDFAACGTYKWLLGDMGLAFFYARADRWPLLTSALEAGWCDDLSEAEPGARYSARTIGAGAAEVLLETLPRTHAKLAHAQDQHLRASLDAMNRGLAAAGLRCLSPSCSPASIRAYAGEAITAEAIDRMTKAGLRLTAVPGYLRLSPSTFNKADHFEAAVSIIGDVLTAN